jgi:hypothetical protein
VVMLNSYMSEVVESVVMLNSYMSEVVESVVMLNSRLRVRQWSDCWI